MGTRPAIGSAGRMKCLVTGARGFVGRALCQRLVIEGHSVVGIARKPDSALSAEGVSMVLADVAELTIEFQNAFSDIDVVFHVASKVDMWGIWEDFYRSNVLGTENVLRSAAEKGVRALVYTSSPSVVAHGSDLRGVDESAPYARHWLAHYPRSKAIAEQRVLASNSPSLSTCALRPHLIWGPGDGHLVPTILDRARSGKLIRIGDGNNIIDTTYIDDCVEAHVCAAKKLLEQGNQTSGKAYFISQGEPLRMWDWINDVLARNDLPPVRKSLPRSVAYSIATVSEWLARLRGTEPLLTRFLVDEMATDHYFDISRARSLLGYHPRWSIADALTRTFP